METLLKGLYRRVARSYRRHGWRHVLGEAISRPLARLRRAPQSSPPRQPNGPDFDRQFHVDTAEGLGEANELGAIDSPAWNHGCLYQPAREDDFQEAMAALAIRHEEFTFIDLGSGKGKTLLMAAGWPF